MGLFGPTISEKLQATIQRSKPNLSVKLPSQTTPDYSTTAGLSITQQKELQKKYAAEGGYQPGFSYTSYSIPPSLREEGRPEFVRDPAEGVIYHVSSREGQQLLQNYYARQERTRQQEAVEDLSVTQAAAEAQTLSEKEVTRVPPIAPEPMPVSFQVEGKPVPPPKPKKIEIKIEPPPKPVPVVVPQRKAIELTPIGAKRYVKSRVIESTGIPDVSAQLVGYRETKSPRALAKAAMLGQQAAQFGVVTGGVRAITAPVAYAFGAAGEKFIPPKTQVLGIKKPQLVSGLEFAGEWAGLTGAFRFPGIEQAPKKLLRTSYYSLGSFARGKGAVFYPELTTKEALLAPKGQVELGKYIQPKSFKPVEKPVKPLTKAEISNLLDAKPSKPTIKTYRQFMPRDISAAEKRALPELGGYVAPKSFEPKVVSQPVVKGMQTVQIQKTVPKQKLFMPEGFPGGGITGDPVVFGIEKSTPISYAIPESYVKLSKGLPKIKPVVGIAAPVSVSIIKPRAPKASALSFKIYEGPKFDVPETGPKLRSYLKETPILKELSKTVPMETRKIVPIMVGVKPDVGLTFKQAKRLSSVGNLKTPVKEAVVSRVSKDIIPRTVPKTPVKESVISGVFEDVIPRVIPREKTIPTVAEVSKVITETIPKIKTRSIKRLRTIYQFPKVIEYPKIREPVTKPKSLTFPKIYVKPLVPILVKPFVRPKYSRGFFPITRKAGKEIPLTRYPVSKEAARAIAIANVIGSPRASYKLVEARAPAVKVAVPRLPKGAEAMFKPAKTLPGFFVEKPKYRIKEPGELAGITAKGLAALASPYARKKKKKSRRFYFGL